MVSFRIMCENIEKSQKVSPWVWRAFSTLTIELIHHIIYL